MNPAIAHRFETEFAPRIAQVLSGFLDGRARAEVVPFGDPDHPYAITLRALARNHRRGYAYPLDLRFTWDPDEIESLFGAHGAERFERYLEALPRKLAAWQTARGIDFASCSQDEPSILLGNLDLEG